MTAQETERIEVPVDRPGATRTGSTRSSGKAYDRRVRRQEQVRGSRLTRTGSPVKAALQRVPFVALVLLLLTGGVVGVLYLNTISDAAGLRASQSRLNQMDIDTRIEAADKAINAMKDPAHLAAEARALGLVPGGDAAIILLGADGKSTVIATPTTSASPAPAPAPAQATPTQQASVVVTVAAPPAKTVPAKAVPAKAAAVPPAAKVAARTTTAPKVAAGTTTAPKVAARTTTAPKVAARTTTAPKVAAGTTTAPKVAARKTTAPKTAGAGR